MVLQSILSQKMRQEAEMEDDAEQVDEELDSDGIGSKVEGGYAETPGATPNYDADTDLSVGVAKDSGKPEQAGTDYTKVADINEEEENPFADDKDAEIAELKARLAELEGEGGEEDPFAAAGEEEENPFGEEEDPFAASADAPEAGEEESEDDMDLEAIIRELEAQLGDDEEGGAEGEEEMYEDAYSDGTPAGSDKGEDPKLVKVEQAEDDKETIDLEEILRDRKSVV